MSSVVDRCAKSSLIEDYVAELAAIACAELRRCGLSGSVGWSLSAVTRFRTLRPSRSRRASKPTVSGSLVWLTTASCRAATTCRTTTRTRL